MSPTQSSAEHSAQRATRNPPAFSPETRSVPLGVIEGFFGRDWSWQARADYAGFLAQTGFDFYLYAPKSDARLRRRWQSHWPDCQWRDQQQLRASYRRHGVRFGLGLSPLELYREPPHQAAHQLSQKIQRLNELDLDILCLLFDDMRGDLPELARRQAELAQVVAQTSNARQLILCPTYYSTDPVLEKAFGQRPDRYWETLGQRLPKAVDIFWTGPRVCSGHYPHDHLERVAEWLGRKPFLWDNYPVNDSAQKSKQLPLMAYPRGHGQLGDLIAGHAVNPMNQPMLSQIPLQTLPDAYRLGDRYEPHRAFEQACRNRCSPQLAQRLIDDQALLQEQGLGAFDEPQRQRLRARYRRFASTEAPAQELLDWLDGGYAFDPACLTD